MTITLSPIKKFITSNNTCTIAAELCFPNLIIVENNTSIHIANLVNGIEENHEENTFSFDTVIKDWIIKDNYLWLTFASGDMVIISLLSGKRINIVYDSCINFKINGFKKLPRSIHFISISGESFETSISYKVLLEKLEGDPSEITLEFKKVHTLIHRKSNADLCTLEINGVIVTTEHGALEVLCPLTGLTEIMVPDMSIHHFATWKDLAVFVDQTKNMKIVDLKNSQVVFEFGKTEANYYPMKAHNDLFYYLSWNAQEIQVYCAGLSSSLPVEGLGSEDFNEIKNSQENLKNQLISLLEIVMSSAKLVNVSDQLQPLFDAINDLTFLLDVVSKLCQHNIIYKSLVYPLQKRIYVKNDSNLYTLITDLAIKIDLLEYIQFTGKTCYESVNLFEINFQELCITFISKLDFDIASICWLKYSQLPLVVHANDVVNILNAISPNAKISAIMIWLKKFTPSLLEKNPYYIDLFVRWASERVFMLEQSSYWPKIGLKFISETINILEASFKTICIRPISVDDLDLLQTRITNIMELKDKYKINMLLSELSSQSASEVALIMLRRCYTEDLQAFLRDYLQPYVSHHLLNLDDMLLNYIENEASSSGGGIDSTRLKILLDSFHTLSNKLNCLLQVLKILDVPWNPTVVELVVYTIANTAKMFTICDVERSLVQEMQKELNYANVKVILKKYNFPIGCTDYMLVLYKIIGSSVINLNDFKVITSVMPAHKHFSNALYVIKCLQNYETNVALEYFYSLPVKDRKILLKTMMAKYEQIINRCTKNMTVERNYIDFLKGTQLINESEMINIQNLYHFKNSYNIKLNMNTIYNERDCEYEFDARTFKDAITSSQEISASLIEFSNISLSQQSMLKLLLRRTSTCHKVRTLVESLLSEFPTKSNDAIEKEFSILKYFKNVENSYLLLDCYSVLIELATKCEEEYLHNIMKIISVFTALMNVSIIVKNLSTVWKFHYIFLPISSNSVINDLIDIYTSIQYQDIIDKINTKCQITCDFTPFRVISSVLLYCTNLGCGHLISEVSKKLLTKVVSTQDLDVTLLTALLLILKNTEENTSILEVLKGQNEFLAPQILSYLTALPIRRTFIFDDEYNKEFGKTVSFPPQYILKSKFNINLADVALPENSEETWDVKVILFYVLIQYPDTSYNRLIELCRALNVSINEGLTLQLISLLSSWELKYEIIMDELGDRKIVFENNKEPLNKCLNIWDSMENKDFLKEILNDFWTNGEITLHGRTVSINQYHYEVLLCIYQLIFGKSMEMKNTKAYFLLNFLKEYKRISSPKQYEFELFSVKGMFPEVGYFRLPFHLFMREDMWSNLKSEITLETYERWLPVVALLSLDSDLQTARDMICSNAVKQTMTTRKRNGEDDFDKSWCLTNREEPLLRAAHRCVRHIANMEWAGACLFYVLQGCARGADQVAAAQLCYQFAQHWAALQPGNRAVRQMERLHATLSTRHALYKIDWACEDFVRLLAEPAQLIHTLYLHPDFVSKINRHDVNRVANEIADKNGINISSIRIQILENILDKISENKSKNNIILNIRELITAKYILRATCPKMGAIYLSRIAFDDESDQNKSKKLRALQCLMSVIDQDTAVKVTNRERTALWCSLLEVLSVVSLENIDMPWIAAAFMQDKIRAIDQLLQATEGNVDGIKVAAELVYRYGTSQLIRTLVSLLLRTGLYENLSQLLLKIPYQLDNITCSAWRAAILSPFQRADYPITERQKAKCLNAINLLPICPVIKDEDMVEVWKNCVRCKCLGLGCLVLPYMTSQTRQTLTELQKIDRRNLIASLKNLHSDTYLVSGAMHVIERMASKSYR